MPATAKKTPPQNPPPMIVTAATVAACLGISVRMVNSLAGDVLVRAGPNAYELERSVRGYVEELRRTARGRGDAATSAQAATERAKLIKAQAEWQELKNARQRGSVLDAEAVEREWAGILAGVRARMLAVASRLAQRLPHLTPHDVASIDGEVRDALSEAGDGG